MKQTVASLVLILLAASTSGATTLTLDQYEAALMRMRSLIDGGQPDAARAEAKTLAGSEVESANGTFHADGTLLGEVNAAKTRDLAVEKRIDATLAALHRAAPANRIAPDPALIRRIEDEQTAPALRRGGKIVGVEAKGPLLRAADAMRKATRWVGNKIVKLAEWLMRFWPDSDAKKAPVSSQMRWTIGSLVALIVIVLGVLAFEVVRRSRRAMPRLVEESPPLSSSRDDDPLSRGASEWERYAAQLAAAGKLREAIRAWYHAVLVTLYAANVLHFRKGRTNWEYIASIGPEVVWRREIIGLTRRFEEEWYGSDQSSDIAFDECRDAARRIIDIVRRTKREAA